MCAKKSDFFSGLGVCRTGSVGRGLSDGVCRSGSVGRGLSVGVCRGVCRTGFFFFGLPSHAACEVGGVAHKAIPPARAAAILYV